MWSQKKRLLANICCIQTLQVDGSRSNPTDFLEESQVENSVFQIPYPPNPTFVGRASLRSLIHENLVLNPRPGFTSSFALYGLGGIGKTQIVARYAHDHRHLFDVIWWLQANDRRTLVDGYMAMSRDKRLATLTLPQFPGNMDSEAVAFGVKRWFENHETLQWLLIFDNLDRIGEDLATGIVELIPKGHRGCVLMTGRDQRIEGMAIKGYEVKEMEKEEAVQLLVASSRYEETNMEDAFALVHTLGYLPLAIEQAGGYIRSNKGVSFGEYLSLFERNKPEALKSGLQPSHQIFYKQTVSTT